MNRRRRNSLLTLVALAAAACGLEESDVSPDPRPNTPGKAAGEEQLLHEFLRDANLYSGVTVVNCLAMFGGIDILVPEELEVDANGTGVFGGFEQKAAKARKRRLFRGRERAPSPELELEPGEEPPLLVIRGFALFGGVTIRVR